MFETSLVDSSGRPPARRWLTLPLSIAIHAGLIGGAMAAAAWSVDDPVEPPGRIDFGFLSPGGPSAPPAGNAASMPAATPATTTPSSPALTQPSTAPESIPPSGEVATSTAQPIPPGSGVGSPGGGGGSGTGIVDEGGTGTRPGTGRPSETTHDPYDSDDPRISPPVELFRVQPDYPESARKAKLQGTVVLQAVISRSGTVESVAVARGVNALLDAAAVKAVSKWRYAPARFGNEPVPVTLNVTVRFQLE
jgi:periplasmic protein TonB